MHGGRHRGPTRGVMARSPTPQVERLLTVAEVADLLGTTERSLVASSLSGAFASFASADTFAFLCRPLVSSLAQVSWSR